MLASVLIGPLLGWYQKWNTERSPDYSVVCIAMCEEDVIGYDVERTYYPILRSVSCPEIPKYTFVAWEDGSTGNSIARVASEEGTVVYAYYKSVYDHEQALPTIRIETEDGQAVDTKEYRSCNVSLEQVQEDWGFDGRAAQIKCRGTTSFTNAEKKSFQIKFDQKTSLFGSVERKKYTLIANYFDKTLARNAFAYDLSDMLSGIEYTTTHEWVEVWVDQDYLGVYLLCDQIQTGEGRVEISESAATLDTGYLIEMDMRLALDLQDCTFIQHEGVFYEMISPEIDAGDPDPFRVFIWEYLNDCTTALREGSWEEVTALMDVDSFVDTYVVQELMANNDVGWASFYLYKKENGGKLYAGPVWDFDRSAGVMNENWSETDYPPDLELYARENNFWYSLLMEREPFVQMVRNRLAQKQQEIRSLLERLNVDSEECYYTRYAEAIDLNFARWPLLGQSVGDFESQTLSSITSVEGQYRYLYDWLTRRLCYLLSAI
ncbi:MAG: CotH kinase family protein [Christensenellaceae bacterium]